MGRWRRLPRRSGRRGLWRLVERFFVGARLVDDQDNWPIPDPPSASTIGRDVDGILGITEGKKLRRASKDPKEMEFYLHPDDEDCYILVTDALACAPSKKAALEHLLRMLYDGDDERAREPLREIWRAYQWVDQIRRVMEQPEIEKELEIGNEPDNENEDASRTGLRPLRVRSAPGERWAQTWTKARAQDAGFTYEQVTRNMQGTRNPRHRPIKNIREELVVELRSWGVAQRVVGAVLNVAQERVSEIEPEKTRQREILPASESPREWNAIIDDAWDRLDQLWSDDKTPGGTGHSDAGKP